MTSLLLDQEACHAEPLEAHPAAGASRHLHTRISWDPDGQRVGVERQRVGCEALCACPGWEIAQYFEDNDASAYSGKRRRAYERMLSAIEERSIGAIVTWHNDRLTPLAEGAGGLHRPHGTQRVRVAVVTGGDHDLTTPEGRFTARIAGAVARKESKDRSRRVRRKHLDWPSTASRPGLSAGACATTPSASWSGRRSRGCLPVKA